MFAVILAIALLLAAVGAIYLLLRNMGQEGVEVAAPGSCKSGRCGVQRQAVTEVDVEQADEEPPAPAPLPTPMPEDSRPERLN